ncbi:MAG: FliM/FliN family flagellar motor switch protein [Acidobacteria bacterium]|jgi:flagellar motor switch protein FliN/FliY|nr:FliM/FliN family flagellar motor switch protein [Acidobacteriota bacterium]
MTSLEQIAHYAEVPIDVSVELDRRILTIRQILDLETGSVVKLGRSAGENIDILVGGTLMAFGEIVIIEDTMGVRITDFNQEE